MTWAERPAVKFDDQVITFGELPGRAQVMRQVLARAGVVRGEAMLIMIDNSIEYVDVFVGTGTAGIIQVPINTEYRGTLLRHVIEDSGARVILVDHEFVPRLTSVGPFTKLDTVIVVGPWVGSEVAGVPALRLDALLADTAPLDAPSANVAEHEPIAIMYTSGTTGPSKGVLIAHRHAFEYARGAGLCTELHEGDVYYAPLPLFHVGGQWAILYASLIVGATARLKHRFSVREFWSDCRNDGITVSFLLGAMAQFLHSRPRQDSDPDNPLERVLMTPLVAELADFRERFGVQVSTCYGSTEVNVPLRADFSVSDSTVAGVVVPGYNLRLVDENDNDVLDGTVGELVLRPPEPWMTMIEYHGYPETTAKAQRNLWLHSGDLFKRDPDGTFHFVDRLKDAIRRRGENISSFELEREVLAFPAVGEAAAIALPSAYTEDEVGVVVVAKDGHAIDADDLRAFLAERAPRFMIPDKIWVIPDMPKTPTGKIQKNLLREQFGAVRDAGAAARKDQADRDDLTTTRRRA